MNLATTIIFGMGTSEGAIKGWDTRGRGRRGEYGFVSPNTEEGLNFEQAYARLSSPEHQQAIAREKELVNQVLGSGIVRSAVGDWSDGAENSSVIFSQNTDKQKLDYTMAQLGMEMKQKAVISFVSDKNGDDTVWTLNTSKDMNVTRTALDDAGVKFRTLVPGRNGTTIHIFDQNSELADNVGKAAKSLGSSVQAMSGTGSFIGGDTREEGEKAYRQIIESYRQSSPSRIAAGRADGWKYRIRRGFAAAQEINGENNGENVARINAGGPGSGRHPGTTTFYHGTTMDNADVIREQGLTPHNPYAQDDNRKSVSLTTDYRVANRYGYLKAGPDGKYAVVRFDVPKDFANSLKKDPKEESSWLSYQRVPKEFFSYATERSEGDFKKMWSKQHPQSSLAAGGAGSGCNPQKGKCGRTKQSTDQIRKSLNIAGQNRNIVILRYNKDGVHNRVYVVQPYSWRGDRFYGYDTADKSIKAFLLHKIHSVKVTSNQFKPQWKVELKAAALGYLYSNRKLHKRIKFQGLDISVENRAGSVRKGVGAEGAWQTKMRHDYGYVKGSQGLDGGGVDCFVGPNAHAKNAYVVHIMKSPGFKKFDEDKVMLGFNSAAEAKKAFMQHYDDKRFFGSMDAMPMQTFKEKAMATGKNGPMKIEANLGEPQVYDGGYGHIEPMPIYHAPSNKWAKPVPTDSPMETDDSFMDVTKREETATKAFRNRLTKQHPEQNTKPLNTTQVSGFPSITIGGFG